MNDKVAKAIRKKHQKVANKHMVNGVDSFIKSVQADTFKQRVKFAWMIITKQEIEIFKR